MPAPTYQPNLKYLISLNHELKEREFDIDSSSNTNKLKHAIYEKTGQRISRSTLIRMLAMPENRPSPYLSSLNLMAAFCDFADWEDFKAKQNEKVLLLPEEPETWLVSNNKINSLLQILILNEEWEVIHHFFREEHAKTSPLLQIQMGVEVYVLLWEKRTTIEALPEELQQLPLVKEFKAIQDNLGHRFLADSYRTYTTLLPDYRKHDNKVFLDTLFVSQWLPAHAIQEIQNVGELLFMLNTPHHIVNMPDIFRYHYLTAKYRYFHTLPQYDELPTRHLHLIYQRIEKLLPLDVKVPDSNADKSPMEHEKNTKTISKSGFRAWINDLHRLEVPQHIEPKFRTAVDKLKAYFLS